MESVRALLSIFLKIAIVIFFVALIMWLTSVVGRSPGASSKNATSTSTPKADILPSPRKYSGFFTTGSSSVSNKNTIVAPTLVTPEPFVFNGTQPQVGNNSNNSIHGNGYTYNTYDYSQYPTTLDANGNYVINAKKENKSSQPVSSSPTSLTTNRSLYIRNLSIYEGGHVYTGLSFVGEARSTMFREGKFPIAVVDASGRLIGISVAIAQTTWSVPGWVRFETKITYPLPNNVPCTMVFEGALTQQERQNTKPVQAPFGIRCN